MGENRRSLLGSNVSIFLFIAITSMSTSSWANTGFDFIEPPSIHQQDQDKLEEVKQSEEVRSLLSESDHHTLGLTQKVTGPSEIFTTKFQHYYDGLEVLGSMSFHHRNSHGTQIRNHLAEFDLNTHPEISVEDSISLAQGESEDLRLQTLPKLLIFPQEDQKSARLIYWISLLSTSAIGGKDVLIDAHSGQKIAELPHHYTLAPIQIYSAKNKGIQVTRDYTTPRTGAKKKLLRCTLTDLATQEKTTLTPAACFALYQGASPALKGKCQAIDQESGDLISLDATGCTQVVKDSKRQNHPEASDPSALRAADYSKKVLTYYKNHFNRNSYDNQGSDVTSVIHAGQKLANAMWMTDLNTMVYGDGDGEVMGDMTLALDVAGHEMTHGITEHTAKLIMEGEPGALNEAFSDFFGKLIESRNNWIMGGDLFKNSASGPKGIRNIADPAALQDTLLDSRGRPIQKPYPTLKSEQAKIGRGETCSAENDYCYVHYNSTIPSHAAYLILQAIGEEKAELLYYTTLTQNLSSTDDFTSSSKAVLSTCHQLNFSESDCGAVKKVFFDVGLLPIE